MDISTTRYGEERAIASKRSLVPVQDIEASSDLISTRAGRFLVGNSSETGEATSPIPDSHTDADRPECILHALDRDSRTEAKTGGLSQTAIVPHDYVRRGRYRRHDWVP